MRDYTAMNETPRFFVAGRNSDKDWREFRESLRGTADTDVWIAAFEEYFMQRLNLRYLNPISFLQANGDSSGEGFSIAAIQCTLIEFLEATRVGLTYRYLKKGEKHGPYEYSDSCKMFVDFLSMREPFARTFDRNSARDFYVGVRCGLLHEAQTRNGWRILARGPSGMVANVKERVMYRDNFQDGLKVYVEAYKDELLADKVLQDAFARKFDSLCRPNA